jgi:ribonucleoside-diphosphate reductase alpha chain
VNSSSGIHGRFADYYIRRVRQSNNDPFTGFLIDEGVPAEFDVMNPSNTTVFSFVQRAPEGSIIAGTQTAIEQLENWLLFQENWAEHSCSITVYVKEGEWTEVGAWVYRHFDKLTGISFLPYTEHTYKQAPYEAISKEKYEELLKIIPQEINIEKLIENEDGTTGAKELACVSGVCEI